MADIIFFTFNNETHTGEGAACVAIPVHAGAYTETLCVGARAAQQ